MAVSIAILNYIDEKYPQYSKLYDDIYRKGHMEYWAELSEQIETYCVAEKLNYMNYFYHKKLVQEKLEHQFMEKGHEITRRK